MAMLAASDPLKEAFERFKHDRGKLKRLLDDTQNEFRGIQEKLHDMPFASKVENLLLLDSEKKTVERVFQDPCIIMVGQTKSGKSSLINELLGKTIVTADQRPCTARLVELQYGDVPTPVVTVKAKDGHELEHITCKKNNIPAKLVNLSPTDRENENLVESTISVKIDNDFLKSGVKVIDSPGRNENKVLDNMVIKHLLTILPLIVYVIDGKNLLTIQDVADINGIMKNMPGRNIFYIVSKIDPTKEAAISSDEDDDETEEESDEQKEYQVKRKVFNKLVSHGFIGDDVDMEKCDRFHALSAWKIKTYRRTEKEGQVPPPADHKRYVVDFDRFKQCLLACAKDQLVEYVEKAAESLRDSQKRCLDFFIDTANRLFHERNQIESQMTHIQAEESKLYRAVMDTVQNNQSQLSKSVNQILKKESTGRMISEAEGFQYRTEDFQIPHDGYIKDQDAVEMCRMQLKEFVMTKLNQDIHNVIVREFGQKDGLFQQLAKKVQDLENGKAREIRAAQTLHKILVKCYVFDMKNMDLQLSLWSRIKFAIVDFFKGKGNFFLAISGKVHVGSKKWKKETAERVLATVNASQLSDIIVKGIVGHLEHGHATFCTEIKSLEDLYKRSFKLGEGQREKIRQVSPILARLELSCSDLIDRHRYGNIQLKEQLGRGAQGVVYACTSLGPKGEKCAVKVVRCDSPPNSTGNDALNDLALEIHYSRQFDHPRLMQVFGTTVVQEAPNVFEVQIIYERMTGDLMDILPNIPSMRDRVKIGLEVAEALKYLQENEMIHRDIKCSNILVDDNKHIKLTDFGLCKPEGMTKQSFVGTPIHIAPEIVTGKTYNKAVDIYSFGIVFWYICEGKGNHPGYAHYAPGVGALLLMGAMGKRPERKTTFNDDCWNLMKLCWDDDPEIRPSTDKLIEMLEDILKKPM
ncbi:dual serine/threonine and tyrosine protein kinase-like [Lineus longissimus]|uniref:dual serine/threonine and tyrosine protein kinase-like n=1 Tax=Lineus longissimus TaxID=88925 RepID=UPI002B4E814D